ncbi:MAG: hypothetical protein CM15mP127_07530 [Gammaproteobacteria bacterium]|nr:MAG: hypothetical protein CM15mP127_07530 [Gammaproteobacteria bacterium]
MNFDQSSSYSKEDLIDCGNGELFGPKMVAPVNEMLMFDRLNQLIMMGVSMEKAKLLLFRYQS